MVDTKIPYRTKGEVPFYPENDLDMIADKQIQQEIITNRKNMLAIFAIIVVMCTLTIVTAKFWLSLSEPMHVAVILVDFFSVIGFIILATMYRGWHK